MRRREVITLLGGAAAYPFAARAQQPERMRRIGILHAFAGNDPLGQRQVAILRKELQGLGWRDGQNVRIDVRFASGDAERVRAYASELVAMKPDVILASTTAATAALLRQTRTIPIVFVVVSDPVGSGFVQSLARPGKNATGFSYVESSVVGKWVELLREVAPQVTRVAMMFNPDTTAYAGYYMRPFEAAARSAGMEPIGAPVRDDAEIENAIAALARNTSGGLILMPDIYVASSREQINRLALRHRIPAVNGNAVITRDGGLISYSVDGDDLFRRAGAYVDQILRGANPAELPVQLPIKFQLIINLKTAKALGVTIPQSLLLRADEVIE